MGHEDGSGQGGRAALSIVRGTLGQYTAPIHTAPGKVLATGNMTAASQP